MTSCVQEHESLGVAEEVEQESEHEGQAKFFLDKLINSNARAARSRRGGAKILLVC